MIVNQNMSTNPVGFNKSSKVHERQNNNSQNQNFQSRPNNNQFQAILSQLLPLLIQLLNSLQNNKPTCDPLNPKEVPLSSVNVNRLKDSVNRDLLTRPAWPGGANLISITSILDKDCSGDLSVGDELIAIHGSDTASDGDDTYRMDTTISSNIMNLYNSTEVLFPTLRN